MSDGSNQESTHRRYFAEGDRVYLAIESTRVGIADCLGSKTAAGDIAALLNANYEGTSEEPTWCPSCACSSCERAQKESGRG